MIHQKNLKNHLIYVLTIDSVEKKFLFQKNRPAAENYLLQLLHKHKLFVDIFDLPSYYIL